MKQTVSIVIPLYNEQESITSLLSQLEHVDLKQWAITEYVFVDDGSTDGSFELLRKYVGKTKRKIILVRFRKNLGKSAAMSVGFRQSSGDYVVTLDADLQDEPSEIPRLLTKLTEGEDFVIGWRKNRKDVVTKKVSSKIFNTIVSKMYHISLHDMNSGLKAFTREVAQEISLYGELHRFMPVLAASRGFRVTEVPVEHHHRRFGTSKYNGNRVIHAFFDLGSTLFLTSFEHEPMQVFGMAGTIGIVLGLIVLVYLSVLHFMGQSIIRRPLLFLGILFVLFGMQIVSTGLIGELIIHKQRDDARNYPVAEIVK